MTDCEYIISVDHIALCNNFNICFILCVLLSIYLKYFQIMKIFLGFTD